MSAETNEDRTGERAIVDAQAMRGYGARILLANGLPEHDAAVMAACLVRADLRGVDTHGMQLLPRYLKRLRDGFVNPRPDLKLDKVTPVAAALDGDDGYGFVTASFAMDGAIAMAKEYGIGLVSVRRSTHFGMAAAYVLQAVEAGFASLVFTNASRAMPPWGGRAALLGTSPFAAGAPGGELAPYGLDMSPAVAARGKIRRAERRGEAIPIGYALDADGRPTTDPTAALGGVVLPIGGPKGSAIAMLMDILSGVMSGSAFGGDVGNQFLDHGAPQDVGHFILAIKPDLFVPKDAYEKRMDTLVERVRDIPTAEGFEEILMPGEIEGRLEAERLASGIPYPMIEFRPIVAEGDRFGIPPVPTR